MPLIQNTSVTQVPPPPPPPAKIHTSATAWDLEASPEVLREAATNLRTRASNLTSAQLTVDESARLLTTNQDWTGDSADVYQNHRVQLTGDMGAVATAVCSVADTLDGIAAVLTYGQAALDQDFSPISAIPHPRSGHDFVFHPATAEEATCVRNAMTAATETRANIDEALAILESALVTAKGDLSAIAETWTPRTLTVTNLNVGQGFGNEPWWPSRIPWLRDSHHEEGTDSAEMDEIADIIRGQDTDIATLQEVFEEDLDELEEELESDGSEWNVHYREASDKPHFDDTILDAYDPDDFDSHSFGNAIFVRESDTVVTSDRARDDGFKLDISGSDVPVSSDYPHPDVLPDEVDDGEGRSATVAEVEIRER